MFDPEEEFAPKATYADAFREFGYNAGMDRPDQAWLLTDWDVWVANPHYRGPKVPHPESYEDEVDYDMGPNGEVYAYPIGPRKPLSLDDDIPF